MIKSTALLTIALFFTVAPSPDANVLSEMTGGFLKANNGVEISATEFNPALQNTYVALKSSFKVSTGF